MSIIRHTNFDKTVNTIADRNAISKKINHMTVLVNDAIADINAGAGKATYRWDASDSSWVLISKSNTETVSFITEELAIANREVTLSNYPMNNAVWNAVIINNGIIQGDLNLNTVTITGGKIINIDSAFNGQTLRVTYAFGSVVAQLNSVIEDKVASAVTEATGNINLGAIETNIIPLTDDTLEIGSPTNRFKSIYVNEAYLSTNTLYIGDTPILGTDDDTITVKADMDQSILVKTVGTGITSIQSSKEVNISTDGMNADVKLLATGVNGKVRLGGTGGIELSTTVTAQDNLNVSGNFTLTGNFIHNGQNFISNATTVVTKDNIIVLNQGELGTGVTAGKAGIQIDRGDESDYQLIFNETTDKFTVGPVGGTHETLATREYTDGLLTNKVDKVVGKQLSTEDYSSAEKTKLAGLSNYTLPIATSTTVGGIGVYSDTVQSVAANAVTTTANRTYGIQLNSAGQAVVNVPWVETNTVYTHPTTDGNLHVPATGTTNNGKVLMAGSTAGSLSWGTIANATTTTSGLMSSADKTLLDNLGTIAEFEAALL